MNRKDHQHEASHNAKVAEEFHKIAEHDDTPPAHKPMFKALACHADAAAEHHLAACKTTDSELEKADSGELVQEMRELVKALRSTVVPSGVSVIPTSNRPVARYGQPDVNEARKAVDPILRDKILPADPEPSSVVFNQR
jgi:hypothetical protein